MLWLNIIILIGAIVLIVDVERSMANERKNATQLLTELRKMQNRL